VNNIITYSGRFSGGYFVLNNKKVEIDYLDEEDNFYVTNEKNQGLLNSILNLISTSKNYLKICSFIIDNRQVVESIINRLKQDKIPVFILTAVDDKNIKSDILDENEFHEFSKSRHFEFIDELVKEGAHLRASSNAHAKFVIKDGQEALLMSANLTEPSLNNNEKGNDPNKESGIEIKEEKEVKILERIFDSVFLYGTEFRKFINLDDNTQLISKNEIEIQPTDFPQSDSSLVWTYETYHHLIYDNINSLISAANNTLKLSTYSIVELNNLQELISNIISFKERSIGPIKIFCRAMNHRADHLTSCKLLAEMGIEIYGDMFNHSKGISIDNSHGMIFTANIDGKHGLKSGFEVGYYLERSNKSFTAFNAFMDYQIESAPYVFKLSPYKRELFEFYENWYKTKEIKVPNTVPEILEIKFRSNAMNADAFVDGITNYPVFFTILNGSENNELQFIIDEKAYLLEKLNESTFSLKKQLYNKDIVNAEKYILAYKQINLTSYES